MYDTVIIRYGEIFLKSEYVKNRFEDMLVDNVQRRLSQSALSARVYRKRHRIYLRTDQAEEVATVLKTVYGIVSASPAKEAKAEIDDISSAALEVAGKVISPGDSFAVRAERSGRHAFSSKDVEVAVGGRILEMMDAKVYLDDPAKTIYIEVRDDIAYVYDRKIRGLGGLPYGSQGRLIALVSTGIDSPVAAWMMMRRGCRITVLHMGETDEIAEVVGRLESYAGEKIRVYSVPYDAILGRISEHAGKYTCVVCKRFMHRLAEKLMEKEGAAGIVSGENIGQVASQTLENLQVIDCLKAPVYRPLVALDKEDIIKIAKDIGTYPLAKPGRCKYVPHSPSTQAREDAVRRIEDVIGIEDLIEDAFNSHILKNG